MPRKIFCQKQHECNYVGTDGRGAVTLSEPRPSGSGCVSLFHDRPIARAYERRTGQFTLAPLVIKSKSIGAGPPLTPWMDTRQMPGWGLGTRNRCGLVSCPE